MTAAMHSAALPRRLVALVRTHLPSSARVTRLAGELAAAGFEVEIAADETRAVVDPGGFPKRPHSVAQFEALGLRTTRGKHRLMWYRGDYALIGSTQGRSPSDFFLMVEYDVGLREPGSDYWSRLRGQIVGAAPDLVGTFLGPYSGTHFKHDFAAPWKCFFPVIGLSGAAIDLLERERRRRVLPPALDRRGVHCEVFVPSVVQEAGLLSIDLNALVPGSVDRAGFSPLGIIPEGYEAASQSAGALLHRVAGLEEFVTRAPALAHRSGRISELRGLLARLDRLGADPAALARCERELAGFEQAQAAAAKEAT